MRLVVVDAGARCSELGPHVHVESVDHLTTCVKGCFFGPIGVDGMIMSKRWRHTFHCPHMFIPQGASKVACGRISTGMLYSSREEERGRQRERERETEREPSQKNHMLPQQIVGIKQHLNIYKVSCSSVCTGPITNEQLTRHIDIIHLSAVETTAELDDALTLLQSIVFLAKFIRSDAQLLGSIHGVVDEAILHDLAPLHTKPCSSWPA